MSVCDFDSQVQVEETDVREYLTDEQWAELDVEIVPTDLPDLEPYGLKQRIESCQTPAREMLLGLYSAMAELIEIPNHLLRDEFRTKKADGRSVAELERMLVKSTEVDEDSYESICMAKRIRLDSYCDQEIEANQAIMYCEDERRLNNAQIKFLNTMVRFGVIEADDLQG
jgi:hypothetical protein